MRALRFVRFVVGLAGFFLTCIPAATHLYLLIAWDALLGVARRKHRIRVGRWRALWVSVVMPIMCKAIGLRIDYQLPENDPGRPAVFVSNHRTLLDIFVLVEYARRMGRRDVRWILKKPLRYRASYIGRSCHETECAFVVRGAKAADIAEVERAALIAKADQASMAIFPEGTRFRAHYESPYEGLLEPRVQGLAAIRRVLDERDHDVVAVTLDWRGGAENARTMFRYAAAVKGSLTVSSYVCSVSADEVAEWLLNDWKQKENALAD